MAQSVGGKKHAASAEQTGEEEGSSLTSILGLLSYEDHLKKTKPLSARPQSIPVFVMLPLNTVKADGQLNNPEQLRGALKALALVGVQGVMVDVWWGVAERNGPMQYDWAAYKELVSLAKVHGLHIQAVMSFHACGPNVGDEVDIPLPSWVLDAAKHNPSLLYRDKHGYQNPECLSLWADEEPALAGRTPLQCYADFMASFRDAMAPDLGEGRTITDVCIGCGPCGELRYPSYPENRRALRSSQWLFPGVGEFQCYDHHALTSLRQTAELGGVPQWGTSGPHDAGGYNDWPESTGFFRSEGGSWDSDYGHFFLDWYAQSLCDHGERMLRVAREVFAEEGGGGGGGGWRREQSSWSSESKRSSSTNLSMKLAGVHWWYNSRPHAAELTAGYYNVREGATGPARNGYERLVQLCSKYNTRLNFTCVEMRDCEHPTMAQCSPEGLLRQVRLTAAKYGVLMSGENALCRFDESAHEAIVEKAFAREKDGDGHPLPPLTAFTFLRMFPEFFDERNLRPFVRFVRRMSCEGGVANDSGDQSDEGESGDDESFLRAFDDYLAFEGEGEPLRSAVLSERDGGSTDDRAVRMDEDDGGWRMFRF